MDYKIIETTRSEALESKVRELLAQGWELQGGVSIAIWSTPTNLYDRYDTNYAYCQAMIKP